MRSVLLLFFLGHLLFCSAGLAKRLLQLDLQRVEESVAIEVGIKNVLTDQVLLFKTESDQWSEKLDAGLYQIRTRSIDKRGVPGVWSDPEEIIVQLDEPLMNSSSWPDRILCAQESQCAFEISWQAVDKSDEYEVQVFENEALIKSQKTAEPQAQIFLEGNKNYRFAVKAISRQSLKLSSTSTLTKKVRFFKESDVMHVMQRTTSTALKAEYDLIFLQYLSELAENQSQSSFSSVGSQFRLGVDHSLNEHWSMDSNLGLAFLKVSGQIFSTSSADLIALYEHELQPTTQLWYGAGFFYDELPVVQGLTTSSVSIDKISVAGPRVLIKAQHFVSKSWGAHLSASSDAHLLKVSGPGGSLSPSYSTQVELGANYWMNDRLKSCFSVQKKIQSVLFKPGGSSSSSVNRVTQESTILSLRWDWSFQ